MFLFEQKIHKKTVMRAAVMLEQHPEFAVLLAFNVKCAPDARLMAEEMCVRLFEAEIIYHMLVVAKRWRLGDTALPGSRERHGEGEGGALGQNGR